MVQQFDIQLGIFSKLGNFPLPARIRVAIARRCEFGARPPAPTARHRPSPALAAFCCTAALCWKRVASAVTLMLPATLLFSCIWGSAAGP